MVRQRAAVLLMIAGVLMASCQHSGAGDGGGAPEAALAHATPPPQTLFTPGEAVDGELAQGETDRWVFAAVGARPDAPLLATVELWFRPASSSGPGAELEATLVGPDGAVLAQERGSVTLPPYIIEQELPQTGSYLLQVDALSGIPGRYTLRVTLSQERLLSRPEVYTSTLPLDWPPLPEEENLAGGWGFVWPTPHRAISGWYFHDAQNPRHAGLDIAAALYDPVYATADGTVAFAGSSGGYGNLIVLDHPDGWQSWYAHVAAVSVVVGQDVRQGDIIGAAGSTGYSSGPHLHFELRYEGSPMDPLVYLH